MFRQMFRELAIKLVIAVVMPDVVAVWAFVTGLSRPLLKFSGGSVTFYATFSVDTSSPRG